MGPSRMMLQAVKQKHKAALTGHSLLKKKSDALTRRFRMMLGSIIECKRRMVEELSDASLVMAKAQYSTNTNWQNSILQNVTETPAANLTVVHDNVAGVKIPNFKLEYDEEVDVLGNIALSSGGNVIRKTQERYRNALQALIELASLQAAFFTLDEQIKMTNRRVNALDNVVIPKLCSNQEYIMRELDENEREEFYRLKKVTEKKQNSQSLKDVIETQ